jgi:hypothetical protein
MAPTLTAITQNDDASASTTDSQIIYTATASGSHYLAAKDDALSTGSYSDQRDSLYRADAQRR